LHLHLRPHDIKVGSLDPVGFELEEELIIYVALYWVFVLLEVEVFVDEGKAEPFRVQYAIYSRGILAWHARSLGVALEEAYLDVTENLRVEVPLQTVIVALQAHVVGDVVYAHLGLVAVREELVAASLYL
jgi:hypothetical protein